MELYPYQKEGAIWLSGRDRALLADEPGLGKSAQLIVAADIVQAEQILVVCPASAKAVWKREIDQWSFWGHDVHIIEGVDDFPRLGKVNIVTYDMLARNAFKTKSYQHTKFMKRMLVPEWDVIICDEEHYMKEADSLRTRAVLASAGLAGRAHRVWLASGTPMPNHPGELWVALCALGATDLNYKDFVSMYCTVGKKGYSAGKPLGAKNLTLKELNKMVNRVMLRRYKEFVMPQLPPIRIDDFPVEEVKIKIEDFFTEAFADKAGTIRKIKEQEEFVREVWKRSIGSGGKMSTMDMVRVLESCGPSVALYRRWLGAVKTASFLPILIEELENKAVDKVVIFAHHKGVINYLRRELQKYNPQVIDGTTRAPARELAVTRFQEDPTARVFIGQNIAAGTAITLTAAHELVSLEPDWVPANNAQLIMRCHRIGQRKPVRARMVRLADTLDDYISDTLVRKTREITRVIGG